jgi:hypothetical protein
MRPIVAVTQLLSLTQLWVRRLSAQSGFTIVPPALLQEQSAMINCWRGLCLSYSQLWMIKVDTRIYMVRATRAQYPMSTGDVVLLCACVALCWAELNLFDVVIYPTFYSSRPWQLHCDLGSDR